MNMYNREKFPEGSIPGFSALWNIQAHVYMYMLSTSTSTYI